MFYSDDPVRDAEMHMARQEAEFEKLPKCEHCKETIQDDFYYEIDGDIVCDDCILEYLRKNCRVSV